MTHALAQSPAVANHNSDPSASWRELQSSFTEVADGRFSPLHREVGRGLAERVGYSNRMLRQVPRLAVDSFCGTGNPLSLAALQPGERVVDLGCGAGLDSFIAARQVGAAGRVHGVDVDPSQLAKAVCLRDGAGDLAQLEFHAGAAEWLPLPDASVDCVIGNGVMNLVADKARAFAECARVLRPGGRVALADVVTAWNVPRAYALLGASWVAGLGGAMHRRHYQEALSAAGFTITLVQIHDGPFRSEAMRRLAGTYGARSISLVATRC